MIVHKYVTKSLKILGWIIASIVGLFLLIILLIQVPSVQNAVKNKAVSYLEGKIHTPVQIGHVAIGLPKKIVLEEVYFQTQSGDTLLAGKKLAIDISLFKLLDDEVEINSVNLNGITANIKRDKDSIFNFDYIIKAFASKKTENNTKETKFSLHNIILSNIRLHFDDAITKNNLNISLQDFDMRMKTFELNQMNFDVPKISLDGLSVKLKQGELVREIATTTVVTADSIIKKRPDLKIKLGIIDLSRIKVDYDNIGTQLNSGIALQKLFIDFEETNLPKQNIAINKLQIEGIKGGLTLGKFNQKLNIQTLPKQSVPNWKLSLANTSIKDVNFRFDDENAAHTMRGIDYKHFNISQLQLEASKFKYAASTYSGKIKSFAIKDQSGLNIQTLSTDIVYNDQGVQLKKLYLKTPQTLLRNEIMVHYPSLAVLKSTPGILGINAKLQQSHIGFKDILLFTPDLYQIPFFNNHQNAIAPVDGIINGQLKDLRFPRIQISGIGSLRLTGSGRIVGLPDSKKAWYNLNIKHLQLGVKDIQQSIDPGILPTTIQLPEQMAVKGTFTGTLNNFKTNLVVNSSFGTAKINTIFDYRVKNKEHYKGVAQLIDFNLGKLIKNTSLGKITLNAKVNGHGLNPKTAVAAINGTMSKGSFSGYTYRNLALNGTIANSHYQAKVGMKDPNLNFDLVSKGSFADIYPQINLKMNVDIADLEKLNLHAGPLKIRGQLDAVIPTADLDYLNGTVTAHHILISNDKQQIVPDSIQVVATATAKNNSLQVKSQFLKANVEGKYQLSQITTAITNSIAKYYDLHPTAIKKITKPQQLAFTVNINNDPIISQLFPEIKQLDPISINGRYNSVNDSIILNAALPKIIYDTNSISTIFLNINTVDGTLVYKGGTGQLKNTQFLVPKSLIEGNLKDNTLSYKLQLPDIKNKDRYVLSGTVKAVNGKTEIHLFPKDLLLNYEQWNIADNNLIRLGNKSIYAQNFELNHAQSIMRLQSRSELPNSPLAIDFTNFDIATFSKMIQQESLAFGGLLNGNVTLENLTTQPIFTSDLTIGNFTFKKIVIGDISLKVNNRIADTYSVQGTLTGQENQLTLDGKYRNNEKAFNLNLDIQHLNMLSIEPFTFDQLTKSSGFVSGKFNIHGTAEQPKVIGNLQFHNGAFTVKTLNSAFELLNDSVAFTEEGLVFEKFSMSDAEKNNLNIRGKIDTPNYRDFAFNLRVNSDNFRVTNSTAKDNDLYYGKLFVDSRLRIKGDMNKPVVDGSIKVNENTQFSIVLPQSDPSIAEREGIVEFIDQDAPLIDERFKVAMDTLNKSKFKGMNVSVAIEVDKKAELNMIIDKGNGDYLKVKGEAQLIGGIDESGKTTLTGRYELKEGTYEMTFNFLKRKFEIQNGSYILWTGEPTTADINISAVYKTLTSPLDLVANQLGDVSATVRNTYKQRIPFETILKMKGELLKPEISFDITLPEGNYNVSSEIVTNTRTKLLQLRQQPNELNKQVFALLLLNRFIGENPFASEAGTGSESLARQSVSKILSQQLNNLAADLIKGVQLDLDLESSDDYTTGNRENRTDLNVGISKQLLNDRLKVTIGSSFGIEGPEQVNRDATNIAGDVSLNYQLSKDGRYMLRAYRKNEYQVALQGQVVETGLAFTITMDYNKFSELFHRSEEDKKIRRDMKKRKEEEKDKAK